MNEASATNSLGILRQLFGDNRAEWPSAHFKELFVAPTYLKKLESMRPCFLVGGRGTGKTTALQSLRYDSILERLEASGQGFSDQEYFGVLVRMNKNRVRAFDGSGLSEEEWTRLFAHYFNLLVCLELVVMTNWLEGKTSRSLDPISVNAIGEEFGFGKIETLKELEEVIRGGISKLQVRVNNPGRHSDLVLSMAESPLRRFVEVLKNDGLIGEQVVFCCIDEYENLLDYQQAVINTYIKHAVPPLSYKVGVKKSGFRNPRTLDNLDHLKTPDDYAEIEIAEEGFEYFAKAVTESRLKYAVKQGIEVPADLTEFLESLSISDEAELLGADKVADEVLEELRLAAPDLWSFFSKKPKHETYFLKYWQVSEGSSLVDLARNWIQNEQEWKTRLGNYNFASLFWLSKEKGKGVRIRKYYCGERVLLAMAAGNIRYFLDLIDTAIGIELEGRAELKGKLTIQPKSQTYAAREVGKRNLNQLERLADHGVQLKRLVLAIGKVFFELARDPSGRAPEVTSFVLSGASKDIKEIQDLLNEGIAHLAFEAAPRTKPQSNLEMRDDEFRLHRIFCAFFEISFRKKRRTDFNARDLLNVLGDSPVKAIAALLGDRVQSDEKELPEQLAFFSAFYDGGEPK